MSKNLHTFIALVRQHLENTSEELDRKAEEYLGKPPDRFTDDDYEALKGYAPVVELYARYEREEAHLRMLEHEAAREANDEASLLAQSELDEDIQGGD